MKVSCENKPRNFIKSLAKGLAVLQTLSETPHPLSLVEIAQSVGINNVTAMRFCFTLSELGFIQRNGQRRYHPTPQVLSLGYSVIRRLDWLKVAQYYLDQLSKDIGETVNLSVLDGMEIMYMLRIRTEKILPYDLHIGSKLPVYCTSMGKVLMAFNHQEKTRPILNRLDFRPLTHRTITCLEDYLFELDKVRKCGYAVNDEELSVGLRSVAAPIRDAKGLAVAAINIAVPTKRFSLEELQNRLCSRIIEASEKISKALREMEWTLRPGWKEIDHG
jgi:IclR family pca regulon transcriptional regulator